MKKLVYSTSQTKLTEIFIGRGVHRDIHGMKNYFGDYQNIVIVTDKNVGRLYLGLIKKQFRSFGGTVFTIVIEAGEEQKHLGTVQGVYDTLVHYGIKKNDAIVALGGGVLQDLVGFIAATYLGGIDFIQMPTTLMAQVCCSIGGEVGINLPDGRNMVGMVKYPECVIADTGFLDTLPDRVLMDGMAEVIKCGCIASSKLFVRLLGYQYQEDLLDEMEDIVGKCIQIKRNILEKDAETKGIKTILNFGSTVAHVVRRYRNGREYTDGEALAVGMYAMTKASVEQGIADSEVLDNMKVIFDTYGLPYEMPAIDADEVRIQLEDEKRTTGEVLDLCVMVQIGKAEIVRMYRENALKLFA